MKLVVAKPGRLRTAPPGRSIVAVLALLATLLFTAVLPVPTDAAPEWVPTRTVESKPLPSWYGRLSPGTPGAFPALRSFDADYRITWSGGLDAAHVDSHVVSPANGATIRTEVKAETTGLARTLYKLDATHVSVVDRRTFRPEHLEQTEQGSTKHFSTRVDFTPEGAIRHTRDLTKSEAEDTASHKPRPFPYPGLFDMEGAFFYLRSQPLKDGDERTLLLMTSGSPYLVTVKVLGREPVQVKAGKFPAIECSLTLEKVSKRGELEPRKGFKSANAWISDDANRLLVKVQSEVFVGSVNLELEKVTYP